MSARFTLEVGHHQAGASLPDAVRPCLSLWGEVLRLAVEDARGGGCMPTNVSAKQRPTFRTQLRDQARAWLTSDKREVGSFIWICSLFELDTEAVRTALGLGLGVPPP